MQIFNFCWDENETRFCCTYLYPANTFKSVLFPEPDGPRIAFRWPERKCPLTLRRIILDPARQKRSEITSQSYKITYYYYRYILFIIRRWSHFFSLTDGLQENGKRTLKLSGFLTVPWDIAICNYGLLLSY